MAITRPVDPAPRPDFRDVDYRASPVALKYVKRGFEVLLAYVPHLIALPLLAMGTLELLNLYKNGEIQKLWDVASKTELTFDLVTVVGCSVLLSIGVLSYFLLKKRPVYMVDFSVYRAPDSYQPRNCPYILDMCSWMATYTRFMQGSRDCKKFDGEALEFQEKILARSGLGQRTYLPPAVQMTPPCPTIEMAREEFEEVMYTAIQDVLDKTGVSPKQIGIVVVNCSLFNPTPSLASMVINKFKLRSNVISYSLAGMGCGSSPISIDLARQMLELYPSSYALVLSTENITQNWYFGNDRSMLMPNCLFRVGGAAILLSNRRRDGFRSKYQLQHTVRTHLGANDAAYQCIYQTEDADGVIGVRLRKELMSVAGEALKVNVTTLGPLVLPISEQVIFMANLILRKVFKVKMKAYIPDFKTAFKHVCIHTGGRAVIDEIEKQLKFTPEQVEPSRATLFRYGNTSSSSIWYVLAYIESQTGVRRGDVIWQMGFGSGFKCNSAVWKALKTKKSNHTAWDGFDVQEMRDHLASLPNHHHKKAQ